MRSQNAISNTGGWTYSGSSCPTCYYTVTGYDSFVGVSGQIYNWVWDGISVCTVVGTFFNQGGGGGLPGCLAPSTETTDDVGFNGASFREQFDMTISDTAQDSFDGYYVKEVTAAPGTNSCWWSTSGLSQNPGVTGTQWTVGTVAGVPKHNHWGYDSIGWNLSDLDNIVRNGPAHGVHFPCTTTIHQGMQIMCNANTFWQYRTDDITIEVDNNPNSETVCRAGECGVPVGFANRWTGSRFEWARILNSEDILAVMVRGAKEAR